jgi:hypothetical protein
MTVFNGASLTMTTSVSATKLSSGQDLVVSLNVKNRGDVTAVGVAPSLNPSATGTVIAAATTGSPSPLDIPAASTITFQWTFHVTGTGTLGFAANARGTDQLSGLLVSAATNIGAIPVVLPAALSAAAQFPAQLSTGQNATLTYNVTNTGQATAKAVTATATGGGIALQTSAPQDIAPNGSFSFTFAYPATTPGALDVSVSASGTDANSGLAVPVGPDAASATVQSQAALTGALRLSQTKASTGQTVQLVLDVTNSGQATALRFTPSVPVPSAVGTQITVPPSPADVPGGATVSFTWNVTAQAASSVTFSAGGSATDANSAAVVPLATVTSSVLSVQTAAQLSSTARLTATQVEVGQPFQLSLDVTNSGGASAAVTPGVPVPAGAGAVLLTTSPSSQTMAGGATVATFTWAYTAQQRGPVSFSVPVTATDANSNASVSPPPAASPSIVLLAPPALAASISAAPSTVANTNQDVTVSLVVTNSGDASLPNVAPVLSATGAIRVSGPSPAAATIAGSFSRTFSWIYRSASVGAATFTASASGTDPVTSQTISASTATPASLTIQSPASLAMDITVPATVNLSRPFQVTVTVVNSGDSGASVTIPAPAVGTGAATATPTSFTSQPVPGQTSHAVVFLYTASATGTISLTANASGTDSTDQNAVTATPKTSSSVTVQTPSQISATLAIPQTLPLGDTFSGSMTVLNSGDASANLTLPSALTAVAIDAGSATLVSGPASGTAVTVDGHLGAILSWTYTASQEGSLQFNAPITVIDATDLTTRTVSASSNISTIAEAAPMAANPFTDGTTFASLASFSGQLWAGPSASGGGAVTMNGDGSGAQVVSWQLEHPAGANNAAYAGTAAHTIGAKGCLSGTAQCGPDNESGRGLFFSDVVSSTEWLGLVGAHVNTGTDYPRYLYLTNPNFQIVAGGYTDLAYSDLGGSAPTSATNATSAVAFQNQLYVGFQSSGGPVLDAVSAMPSLPGSAASAADMGASIMPGIGGTSTGMIDTMAVFGPSTGDTLYLANANGFTRTSTPSPAPCTAGLLGLGIFGSCGDWADSTPSAAAYTAKTSITTTKTSDLEPADRAVPAMASFNGRLFAARNTAAGPQLWACTPLSGTQCSPGDWSLVAANSVGDLQLTQFNDTNNAAITLLAATSQHLYVGFNNATRGVVVYRAVTPALPANPAALNLSQFRGRLDGPAVDPACTGPGTACPGFGGDGLGLGATRIFDGKVFNLSAAENLYLAVGTGTSPVRIYRATR